MRLALAIAAGAALAAAPAHAAVLPGQTLDGPSAAIASAQDVSLAADGTGAVVWLKDVGGQDQVFVSRRAGGSFGPPVQATNSLQDVSRAQVEASNGGRLLVVWQSAVNELKARVSPGTGQPFGGDIDLDTGINGFSSDANDAGVGYVVALKGTDLVGERITGNTAAPVGATIATNGGSMDRAVAVDGAGNAVVAYNADGGGGTTDIVARRLTGTAAGGPIEATVDSLGGRPRASGAANVGIVSDLAGNAWVSFREQFAYTGINDRNRPLVRRLAGNTFGPVLLVDPGPTPPLDMTDAEFIRLAVAPNGANALASGFIQNNNTNKPPLFGASLTPGAASPFALEPAPSDGPIASGNGIVNGGSGFIAYGFQPGAAADYVLRARLRAGTGAFGAPIPLSNPAFGSVDAAVNLATAADASTTGVVAYKQGAAATTRVLVATLDIPAGPQPGGGGGDTTDPVISRFSLSRSTFRKGTKLPKLSAVKTGTTIRFRLSEAATVRLTFEKAAKGRRVGKRCRKPSRTNRRRKRCTRYVRVKTRLSVKGKAGANRLAFQGRLTRRRSLSTGRYRFSMRATDTARNASRATSKKRFRLLAAAKRKKRR